MIFSNIFNPNPVFSSVTVSGLTPTRVVFAGTAGLLTDSANLTFASDILTTPSIQIAITGQTYKFTDRGSGLLALQGQGTGQAALWSLFAKDGDGTDLVGFTMFSVGTPTSLTNTEAVSIIHLGTYARVNVSATGTGTVRPLRLYTGANTTQLVLNTDGTIDTSGAVGIGGLLTVAGSITQSNQYKQFSGTKTLADGSATAFVDITCAATAMIGGVIHYTITATDGTDLQVHAGILTFAAVNKATTIYSDLDEVYLAASETLAKSSVGSTLTDAFTIADGGGKITISCNANSSLTTPTVVLKYTILLQSTNTITAL